MVPSARPRAAVSVHGSELTLGVHRFGPRVHAEGTSFRLWAPGNPAVELLVEDRAVPMEPHGDQGWFEISVAGVGPGARYAFRIGDLVFPDPASRLQEDDAEGRSVVVKPALAWANRRLGRPWSEAIIAEVHVGTATPEGTFKALTARLPHFVETGFTAIQLMPLADFVGRRGWGYDGVLPFAPDRSYGRPEDLVELVQTAHKLGLSVFLDVVYNHFGPVGNCLSACAPAFFDQDRRTPWGPAIDFTRPQVRRFFIESAIHWLDDFGIDGLRFDAVHAIQGPGREIFLNELAESLNTLNPKPHLILENDLNEARLLRRPGQRDPDRFDAQWNDDFHHVFHVAVTGETDGYYGAYADRVHVRVARVLEQGLDLRAAAGEPDGRETVRQLGPTAFVAFVQNHDQIGNRAKGERLTALAPIEAVRLARFVTLLSPQIPLLFMGEEFESRVPFQYFCDYDGDMAEAVRKGRREEFAHFATFGADDLPDPVAEETFRRSKLDWDRLDGEDGAAAIALTRRLMRLRREIVWPRIATPFRSAAATTNGTMVVARWTFEGGGYGLTFNLSPATRFARVPRPEAAGIVGGVTPGPGHWVFEPWSGAIWVDP